MRGFFLLAFLLLAPRASPAGSDYAILEYKDAGVELSEGHQTILRGVLASLKECGNAPIRITSSAERARSSGALQTLGLRADAASAFLVQNGVREERIEIEIKARVKHRIDPKRYPKQLAQYVQVEWECG